MALKIGDEIPNFISKDSDGNHFDSNSIIGQKSVVIYFYPKDNTPGCTTQACVFRDQYEDFKDLGAEVIGISNDSIGSHLKFVQKYKLPFVVLSDSDKNITKIFGVKTVLFGLLTKRVTYVIDKNGIIRFIFEGIPAVEHISKSIQAIKEIL